MKTEIDNNQRVFILMGTGWNTQKYFCNLADLAKCAGQFEKHQPFNIAEFWNYKVKKLTVKKVVELLEANQMDSTFFKKTK